MVTTRGAFQQELQKLQDEILHMTDLVEASIQDAVEALEAQDVARAEAVLKKDDDIDDLELQIEHRCLRLLALQQPMAIDLRTISTGLKMITDLERIADHAVEIAQATIRMADQPYVKPLVDIPRMAHEGRAMLRDVIRAYVERDVDLALEVARRDDRLDKLYKQIFRELLTYMMGDPGKIEQATQLLGVARALERIGDHVTNISEWVIYMVTGERKELNN